MIFSLLILIVVGLIAYYHYLQGFFSAGISAFFAAVAAIVAVACHEVLIDMLNRGAFSDYANGITLAALFAAVYIVLRLISDKLIPGNVQFPLWVDRIGAVTCGIVAGVFAAGIVAIVAQTMPFGPAVALHERYPITHDKQVMMKLGRGGLEYAKFSEMPDEGENFLENRANGLLLPADEILLKLVSHVSGPNGPLYMGRPWSSVHPDYLQELFGQRIGIQSGAKRTALANTMVVSGVFKADSFQQDDPERWMKDGNAVGVRGVKDSPPKPLPAIHKPQPDNVLLVVRATFDSVNADEKNSLLSISPASVRLVAGGRNYFPIGTLEAGAILMRNAPDDYLFIAAGKGADFVFEVPASEVLAVASAADKSAAPKIADGVFIEAKRLARVALGGKTLSTEIPPSDQVQVVRKEGANPKLATAQAKPDVPLALEGQPTIKEDIAVGINIQEEGANAKGETEWGSFVLQANEFSRLEMRPVRSLEIISRGNHVVSRLLAPEGSRIVQITARPATDNKWAWADALAEFQLVDAGGKRFSPVGAFAKVKNSNGADMLVAVYDPARPPKEMPSDRETRAMRPTDVTLIYAVPSTTELRSIQYKKTILQPMQLRVQ